MIFFCCNKKKAKKKIDSTGELLTPSPVVIREKSEGGAVAISKTEQEPNKKQELKVIESNKIQGSDKIGADNNQNSAAENFLTSQMYIATVLNPLVYGNENKITETIHPDNTPIASHDCFETQPDAHRITYNCGSVYHDAAAHIAVDSSHDIANAHQDTAAHTTSYDFSSAYHDAAIHTDTVSHDLGSTSHDMVGDCAGGTCDTGYNVGFN